MSCVEGTEGKKFRPVWTWSIVICLSVAGLSSGLLSGQREAVPALDGRSLPPPALHWTAIVEQDDEAGGPSVVAQEPQAQEADQPRRRRSMRGRWPRGNPPHKNHLDVKAAYREVAASAAPTVAHVLVDGQLIALATLIEADGHMVTKASLLEGGEIVCRFADGQELPATRLAVNEQYDLALLKVETNDRPSPRWRADLAPLGTLVAAVAPEGDPIGIGVVSTEPRRIGGPTRVVRRRAWLGVSLGADQAGTGVSDVLEGSAAAQCGLAPGDRIKRIDSEDMQSMEQIIELIGSRRPGDTIALLVLRGNEELSLSATLGEPPVETAPQDMWGGGPFSERRTGFPRVIAHDVVILPNQCGGPLIDMDGTVIGVNIARALRVATYAIPADTLQQLVREMRPSSTP
jgi:serine protease Do